MCKGGGRGRERGRERGGSKDKFVMSITYFPKHTGMHAAQEE